MLNYDLIVIGFSKAGKALAAKMNAAGKKVAVIERSKAMYGVLALILRISQPRL